MAERFEARLDDLFRDYAALGVRPIDRLATARGAIATSPPRAWRRPLMQRPLRLALVATLSLVLVVAGAALIGNNLKQPEPTTPTPTPVTPTPMPTATPTTLGPTPDASASNAEGDIIVTHVSGQCADPDGGSSWYALGAATVIDLATGESHRAVDCAQSLLLSPDGRNALAADAGNLSRIDPLSGSRAPILGADGGFDLTPLAWSPLGTYFTWIPDNPDAPGVPVYLGSLDNPRISSPPAPLDGGYFASPLWSADERRALFPTVDGWAIGNSVGTELTELPIDEGQRVLAISPDGALIAVTASRTPPGTPGAPGATLAVDVAVGLPETGFTTVTSFLDGVRAVAAEWSPDGATLAIATTALSVGDGAVERAGNDLWLFSGDGTASRHPLPPGHHPGTVESAIRWAPDGARVAVAWHSLERGPEGLEDHFYEFAIVSVSDGRLVSGAGWTPGWIDRVFFSRDGSRVAYGAAASLEVLDLNTSGATSIPYERFLPEFYSEGWNGQLAWLR